MGILAGLIPSILSTITGVYGKMTEDQAAKINLALQTLITDKELKLAQIAVEVEQAKSSSIFIAGARPFVEWGCAIALMYNTLFIPLIITIFSILTLLGVDPHTVANAKAVLPVLDVSILYQILGSLFGISIYPVMDTVKKVNKYKVDNGG